MHVAGGHYRFMELVAKLHDLLVDLDQVFLGMDGVVLLILDHEHIVSKRLDFQIIVEAHQPCDLLLRRISKQSLVKLSASQALPMRSPSRCASKTLFGTRACGLKYLMGLAYQLVQIDSPGLVAHENNRMVGRQLLDGIREIFPCSLSWLTSVMSLSAHIPTNFSNMRAVHSASSTARW